MKPGEKIDPNAERLLPYGTPQPPFKPLTPLADIELRLGLQPLEELHAERDTLVKKVAMLRARHGPGGTWPDMRRVQLATIAQSLRAQNLRDGIKMSETALDDAAHADPRYMELVTTATKERAELTIVENLVQGISETINRQQMIGRYLSSELFLTPRQG